MYAIASTLKIYLEDIKECFNGEDFERKISKKFCVCVRADYECDINFAMDNSGFC